MIFSQAPDQHDQRKDGERSTRQRERLESLWVDEKTLELVLMIECAIKILINPPAFFPRRLSSLLASVLLMVRDNIALRTGALSMPRCPSGDSILDRILQLNP